MTVEELKKVRELANKIRAARVTHRLLIHKTDNTHANVGLSPDFILAAAILEVEYKNHYGHVEQDQTTERREGGFERG